MVRLSLYDKKAEQLAASQALEIISSKSMKKQESKITIDDINSFGNKNEYFISAVHSHLDSIPFAHQLD